MERKALSEVGAPVRRPGTQARHPGASGRRGAGAPLFISFVVAAVVGLAVFFMPARLPAQSAIRQPEIPPILSLNPTSVRRNLIGAAKSHLGTPYRLGGSDKNGLDCSGLVALAFKEATGRDTPRTVDEQALWVVAIPRRELEPGDLVFFTIEDPPDPTPHSLVGLGPDEFRAATPVAPVVIGFSPKDRARADHVGIYLGDGEFIHAASGGANPGSNHGSKPGVKINSLHEPSWDKRYLFAGRAISASVLSGFAADLQLGSTFGVAATLAPAFRGLSAEASASLPLGSNFRVGFETGVIWDDMLKIARVPLELVVGQSSGFTLFAGPALTIGSPRLTCGSSRLTCGVGEADRSYSAVTSWVATAGLRWSPLFLGSSPTRGGLYVELRYDRYNVGAGQTQDTADDIRAAITLGVGLRFRSIHY